MHLLIHVLGIDDPSGRWYLFYSGVGPNLTILGALYGLYRRHNCEIHRCPRIARHSTATGARLCRPHHPEGPLTVERAHAAHEEASL
jgi:hypothetical protein